MANKDEDKMHIPGIKGEAPKAVEAPKAAQAPKPAPLPPPKQEELDKALEELVARAEAAGERDEPAVASARALLDRKSGTKT